MKYKVGDLLTNTIDLDITTIDDGDDYHRSRITDSSLFYWLYEP